MGSIVPFEEARPQTKARRLATTCAEEAAAVSAGGQTCPVTRGWRPPKLNQFLASERQMSHTDPRFRALLSALTSSQVSGRAVWQGLASRSQAVLQAEFLPNMVRRQTCSSISPGHFQALCCCLHSSTPLPAPRSPETVSWRPHNKGAWTTLAMTQDSDVVNLFSYVVNSVPNAFVEAKLKLLVERNVVGSKHSPCDTSNGTRKRAARNGEGPTFDKAPAANSTTRRIRDRDRGSQE